MPSQHPSQFSSPDEPVPAIGSDALERRRMLLKGLGKGGAALAAMSPLASQATRKYTIANGGGTGYCSVSGMQSAAISLAPGVKATTCSGFAPSYFLKSSKVNYVLKAGGGVDLTKTATALGISESNVQTLMGSGNTGEVRKLLQSKNDYVAYKGISGSNACTKTVLANLPSVDLKTAAFNAVFTTASTGSSRFLDILKPPGGAALADNAFYAAAYLSASIDAQGPDNGSIPFDGPYVVASYGKANAATFFRALCTKTS